MITASELAERLRLPESATLDFKRTQYTLDVPDANGRGQLNLVKDILCMSNTVRQESAYIITGVDNQPGRQNSVVGIDKHLDDSRIQDLLRAWLKPTPPVHYSEIRFEGKWIGVYEIPVAATQGPFFLNGQLNRNKLKQCGEFMKPELLYYRRGTTNDYAQDSDKERIIAWFRNHNDRRWQDWDEFKNCCDHFDRERHFVLIASSMSSIEQSNLRSFATIGWSAVIDFDVCTDETGLLSAISDTDYSRNIIRSVKGDTRNFSPSRETYWFFARGASAREETHTRSDDWRTWRAVYGSEINRQLEHIARRLLPAPVTFLVVWNDDFRSRFLRSTLEASTMFEDANYVVVSDTAEHLRQTLDDDYEAAFFEIPVRHICSGLAADFSSQLPETVAYSLPSGSGTPILLTKDKISWLEAHAEIVHLGLGASAKTSDNESRGGYSFLTGSIVTWRELDLGKDAERDVTAKLVRVLRQALRDRDTSRINLFHLPGAGGTTVARRAMWDLHEEYPSVVVRSSDGRGIVERVEYVGAQTGQTVLALVDSADIAEREIEDLHKILQSRHTACILLCVSRRHMLPNASRRTITLQSQLTARELPRFTDRFVASVPNRKAELESIGHKGP